MGLGIVKSYAAVNEIDEHPRTIDWGKVPFAVGCARCGNDLRGLSEPTCPACGLEFNWADAAPIEELTCDQCGYHLYGLCETRCPECGTAFTWEEALSRYRRARKPLFEYRWRDRPIRSFFHSWRRSLRPQKFWSSISIHDPPLVGPLLLMTGAMSLLFGLSCTLLAGIDDWLWWSMRGTWGLPGVWSSGLGYLGIDIQNRLARPPWEVLLPTVTWWITSFLALLVFQQSMRRCRVLTAHVLRVWAYAMPFLATTVMIVTYLISFVFAVIDVPFPWSLDSALILFALIFATLHLFHAYRTYLRMPHSLGVAITSQAMALLAALIVCLWSSANIGASVGIQVLRSLGLWSSGY